MKKNNIIYVKKTLEVDKDLYHKVKVQIVSNGETFKELVDRLLRAYLKSTKKK